MFHNNCQYSDLPVAQRVFRWMARQRISENLVITGEVNTYGRISVWTLRMATASLSHPYISKFIASLGLKMPGYFVYNVIRNVWRSRAVPMEKCWSWAVPENALWNRWDGSKSPNIGRTTIRTMIIQSYGVRGWLLQVVERIRHRPGTLSRTQSSWYIAGKWSPNPHMQPEHTDKSAGENQKASQDGIFSHFPQPLNITQNILSGSRR